MKAGFTLFPNTPQEKYFEPELIRKTFVAKHCRICDEELTSKRKDPYRRLRYFCSEKCSEEMKSLAKLKRRLNAIFFSFKRQKPPINKTTIRYTVKGGNGKQIKYKPYKRRKRS